VAGVSWEGFQKRVIGFKCRVKKSRSWPNGRMVHGMGADGRDELRQLVENEKSGNWEEE